MNNKVISKKQALMIASSLIKGEKVKDDYGFSALKESEDIIQDMIHCIDIEEQNLKEGQLLPNWKSIPSTNPKSRTTWSARKENDKHITDTLRKIKSGQTILDLEGREKDGK